MIKFSDCRQFPSVDYDKRLFLLYIFISLWILIADAGGAFLRRGPVFTYDPPGRVEFSNTTGAVIPCSADGLPVPTIRWVLTSDNSLASDVPGLRHQRTDGSLVFPPFRAEQHRPDIHSVSYRCLASNPLGTIASRQVRLQAVVQRPYSVDVYDEYVSSGSTAVFRCHVPSYVENYVTLTAWREEPTGTLIQPSSTLGGRYLTFPWGTLHVRNVDAGYTYRSYKCQTRNRLTGDVLESSTAGRLIVTESRTTSSPRITDSRLQVISSVRSTVALPCTAQGYPTPTYSWFREEEGDRMRQLTIGEHHPRLTLLEGTLIIRDATVLDEGNYLCVANNTVGEEKVHTHLLITAPLSASIKPAIQRAQASRPWVLNCTVSGHPVHRVSWKKDSETVLQSSEGRRIIEIGRNSLRIDPVRREDRGMYQCFVSNELESTQATVELALGDDVPELKQTFEEQTLQPGESLSLRCSASGNPLPQIAWFLDSSPIPEDTGNHRVRFGDYVTQRGTVVSYVNVSHVKTEDGGQYKCVADNGVGQVFHESKINVAGPPMPVRRRSGNNVTVVAGEVLTLRCPVAGYPLEHIHWERAGVRLPYNHRQKSHDDGTLEVHHVERSTDQGPYTCVATNRKGQSAQATLFVRVQVKPVIEPFTFPKSLREGQRASTPCTVSSGDMPITIRWYKDGETLPTDIGVRSSEVADYSSTLLFESLTLRHKGNYTCEASNEAGSTSHSATMVIHVPPRWVIEPSDVFVVRGKGITVDCQTEGFPQPRVRWRKAQGDGPRDFKSIVSSPHLQVFENGSLAVSDSRESDAGYYLCQATNGIGQGLSKVVRLKVHVAAHFRSKFTAEMVRKGHNTRLKCEALGDKPISISWMKDKVVIKAQMDQRYEFVESDSREGVVSEILIREADRRDSALFSCVAANAYGRDDTNIQLIVQESPEGPQDLRMLETGSRSVKLTWNAPSYNGNSPVTQYFIQYKDESGKWHNKMNNASFPGTETQGTVGGLRPSRLFLFRAIAENSIGRSDPTKSVEVITDEEAPGAAPIKVRAHPVSSQSIRVTWRPPNTDQQHGTLKGYYVGYKASGSTDSYIYKTMEVLNGEIRDGADGVQDNTSGKEECHITGLRRNTRYSVLVQAFNSKGAGPPSDEVLVHTLEHDPPASPPLSLVDRTTSSVRLAWDTNYDYRNPVTGYILQGRVEGGSWDEEEKQIPGDQGFYEARGLLCGMRYQFILTAYNAAGKGEPSDILTTKTEGSAPVAPERKMVIDANMTAASLDLYTWEDGGCPIEHLLVRFRQQHEPDWTVVFEGQPSQDISKIELAGLSPGAWYQVQMSATNSAGVTDAEYAFAAVTSLDVIDPKTIVNRKTESSPMFFFSFLDLTIILPVALSLIVIVIVLIVVCLVIRKKHSSDSSTYDTDTYRKGSDAMGMADMEKCKGQNGSNTSSSYYPQPYATTNLSSSSSSSTAGRGRIRHEDGGMDSGYHQLQEEPLYATVKRTPRPPRTDGHIYHCPGLLMDGDQPNAISSSASAKDPAVTVKLSDSDTERRTTALSKKRRDSNHLRNS